MKLLTVSLAGLAVIAAPAAAQVTNNTMSAEQKTTTAHVTTTTAHVKGTVPVTHRKRHHRVRHHRVRHHHHIVKKTTVTENTKS